jgi:hypothetical protein
VVHTRHYRHRRRKVWGFGNSGKALKTFKYHTNLRDCFQTYEIPAAVTYVPHFRFGDESPHTVRKVCSILEREIQLERVGITHVQFDHTTNDLVCVLQKIMARSKGNGGVKRCCSTSPGGKHEEVRMTIW